MNNIILSPENSVAISEAVFEITNSKIVNHLQNILKVECDQQRYLKIILPNVGSGTGRVFRDHRESYFVEVLELHRTKKRNIHLGIATTRPPMAKRILEHATTLGAASFNFFPADLSEKSYTSSKIYSKERAKEHIQKGMSQCAQFCTEPELLLDKNVKHLIDRFKQKNCPVFWLDKDAENLFSESVSNKEILLLIGPERGWTQSEVEYFKENDIMGVKLSDSVMRVEFAVNAAFAQIEYISNRRSNV